MIRIGMAGLADIPELCRLLGILFAQEREFRPDADIQTRGLQQILGNPQTGSIFAAYRQDRAVGMVSLLYSVSTALGGPVALLEDMIVAPDERNAGLGGLLLDAAIAHARKAGCLRITLLTDADNLPAQRFYARQGFQASPMLPLRLDLRHPE